ncbi:DMSO/selenate family reductase complex B subunit [Vibrio splendidus]|jgi:anaerobic dimethyl sulfoxide reductase subunit B (iron-sulfur subunit)|uniref:Dimethylsulfoxide reductase, chain B n=1 Tax=Vibrio splendidus TaxID=29497 RepID=A0A2N7F5F5_VIBSP|nr:DMSO/selenate family reductase complex B subunit [Vibrio splendidus]PMG20376.1 dimethylsulfoxide reductase, chain B [Vibrio splendidus]PMI72386.1 dimethylsulfoxide reductase, chain B [Vibrio splendidus]PMJ60895.1 dimethylsulfoxide reductase, chain B [Vibrio splendidus]PMK11087.1 dimethylsulfoxide reductase, chain B [Vibrio splendidus]PMK51681.1 dimethylsulfoxide reductase, chain B [Vibrio splendidus]
MIQYGFHVDTSKCTGCKTCQVSCKDRKDLPVGVNWRRVYEYAGGDWVLGSDGTYTNDVFAYYMSIACNHCNNPACVKACPTGAMHKRPQDGLVAVNEDVCVGCRYCEMACPYGAPQYDPAKKNMTKCDGCYDRLEQGLKPVCVESCPLRAIEFGPMPELIEKYGSRADIAPLPDPRLTSPNLIITTCKTSKLSGDKKGSVQNPTEVGL